MNKGTSLFSKILSIVGVIAASTGLIVLIFAFLFYHYFTFYLVLEGIGMSLLLVISINSLKKNSMK